jgi:glycosyltransferase involved in cell wall biosynthesis
MIVSEADSDSAVNSTFSSANAPDSPMVSVVIPHYNRTGLLKETLDSIHRQTYSHWEVVLVDDGSSESELAILRKMENSQTRIFCRNDGLKGPSRCRNLGAQHALGDYLLFLDSDDLLAPWCLESRVKLVSADPGIDAVILPVALFRKVPGDLLEYWNELKGDDDKERFVISDPVWQTSSPLWNKKSFLGTGGFDERVMYGDDGELHLRSLLTGKVLRKYSDQLPDAFIRRADQDRITARSDKEILESRRVRLAVGSELMHSHGNDRLRSLWQSQYVAECEFLLFNVKEGQAPSQTIFEDWSTSWPSFRTGRSIFRKYIQIGWRTRNKYRLILRIARRLAMVLCPRDFFPKRPPRELLMPQATASMIQKHFLSA